MYYLNAVSFVVLPLKCFFHLQTGATPLYIACQKGHLPIVQHLIAAKAEINQETKVRAVYIGV